MIRNFLRAALIALLLSAPGIAVAEEGAAAPMTAPRPIPYKADSASLEDQGARTVAVLVALLALTAGGLHWLRRRIPSLAGSPGGAGRLQVVERLRLNPRSTMYLVRLDGREVLLVQCGDRVTQVDVADIARAATTAVEGCRA